MTTPVVTEQPVPAGGPRDSLMALVALAWVALLAALAAAAGPYFDESSSLCGSLLSGTTAGECSPYRATRERLVVVAAGVAIALFAAAVLAPSRRVACARRPAALTAVLGLLAPGIEIALIIAIRHAWGPTGEEYTGMPDLWAPVALVIGVLLVCLAAAATGLRIGWCLATAAVAVPVVALIQAVASANLGVSDHGVTQPATLPFVYPVGREHPLALAMSGVTVAALLLGARLTQERRRLAPSAVIAGAVFLATSALVTALLVIDASRDTFSFAPVGHWVWAPTLGVGAVVAIGLLALPIRSNPRPGSPA